MMNTFHAFILKYSNPFHGALVRGQYLMMVQLTSYSKDT